MVNVKFVKRKISLIQDELAHLTTFSGCTFSEISRDFFKQAVIERILERIINRAIDINQHIIAEEATKDTIPPKNYKDTFDRLDDLKIYSSDFAKKISRSVGTRNKLVHEYDEVNKMKIYDSIDDCLDDYTNYCKYILNFLLKINGEV